jgi:hypothetical protein
VPQLREPQDLVGIVLEESLDEGQRLLDLSLGLGLGW